MASQASETPVAILGVLICTPIRSSISTNRKPILGCQRQHRLNSTLFWKSVLSLRRVGLEFADPEAAKASLWVPSNGTSALTPVLEALAT
jgi:hypothetical protein